MLRSLACSALLSTLAFLPAYAQSSPSPMPGTYITMSNADLHQREQSQLAAAAKGTTGVAMSVLYDFTDYNLLLVARTHTGDAEQHAQWADEVVVRSGEMTLVVGGTLTGGHNTAPEEIRGTGVEGGESHVLHAGDVAHIPVNVPHWVKVAPGKTVTYLVYKSK